MKIKESKQLKPGDIIPWELKINEEPTTFNYAKSAQYKKYNLVCVGVYSHHVLFRMTAPPHMKVDIQNVDLWNKGIYKQEDIERPFARKVEE